MSNICTINNRACAKGITILKLKDYLNPYDLPDRTIRFKSSKTLSIDDYRDTAYYHNMTLVDSVQHIYDIQIGSWIELFVPYHVFKDTDFWLVSIVGANASSVSNMARMFQSCTALQDVALFDTSSLKHMEQMFEDCTNLSYITPFNVSKVEYADWAFRRCKNVEQGILSMYNALSTNGRIYSHYEVFNQCGINTTTGAAELAQIPSDWK